MDPATLEATIAKVLQSNLTQDKVEFVWHAGEPLTAGTSFYRRAVELIRTYNTRNIVVINSIQTNGTLVNDEWCQFFLENDFFVGLSIDGPAFLHDRQRVNWAGSDSHSAAMRGYFLLKDYGVRTGVICVLTRDSLRYPEEIFSFFLENEFGYVGFNLEEVENFNKTSSFTRPGVSAKAIVAEEYRNFMSRLYDLWHVHAATLVIREFADLLSMFQELLTNNYYSREPLETVGLGIITVQKNGDLTTFSPEFAGAKCDEYGNFVVGHITKDDPIESISSHPVFVQMRDDITEGIGRCRESCMYFAVCGGAFTSNKYFENGSLKSTETTTCLLHRQVLTSVLLGKLSNKPDSGEHLKASKHQEVGAGMTEL